MVEQRLITCCCMLLTALTSVVTCLTFEREEAFLQIVLYQPDPLSGKYTTYKTDLTGHFATAGPASAAEGEIEQIHPLSLCAMSGNDIRYNYGWVGVVQLEHPSIEPIRCGSVLQKAEKALDKGATAIIFDISKHPDAWAQLNAERRASLDRPIILMQGSEASELMNIIKDKKVARARIERREYEPDSSHNQNMNMAIFMGCFVVIFAICMVLLAKIKCRRRQPEMSLNNLAINTLHQLQTRKYQHRRTHRSPTSKCGKESDRSSLTSGGSLCAICLEEFSEGQELRIVPCSHEFHKLCVDPWLREHQTCPLCNFNILNSPVRVHPMQMRHSPTTPPSVVSMETGSPLGQCRPTFYNSPASTFPFRYPAQRACARPYRELFCDAPPGSVPLRNDKFDVVPCAHAHRHYYPNHCHPHFPPPLCRSSPCQTPTREAMHYPTNRHQFHRSATSDFPRNPEMNPMYVMQKQRGFDLQKQRGFDLPPAYDTLLTNSGMLNNDVTSLPHAPRHQYYVTSTPSLASGYLPDDFSDGNISENSGRTFCGPTFAAPERNGTDTSIMSNFGSTSLSDIRHLTSSSSENVRRVPTNRRPATPFIGYSSSDGAEGFFRLSDSSLEGILESANIPSIYDSRDDVWASDWSASNHRTDFNQSGTW
uniref:RING-type E3 ubiquitin transferase n=1 Tax=Phallusia mammillata TaxID=59560 RepID=A0A6F9DYM4_9ASCI|nr:Gl zinc finger (RING)-10 precursor [Phallusia mammillata]